MADELYRVRHDGSLEQMPLAIAPLVVFRCNCWRSLWGTDECCCIRFGFSDYRVPPPDTLRGGQCDG